MDIKFRKAGIADIQKLTEFRQRMLQEQDGINVDFAENISGYFKSAMAENSFLAYVAVLNDQIISTCGITFYKKPPFHPAIKGLLGEICNVYTEKEYRRQGIAKSLLKLIVKEAKGRGVYVLRVSASKQGEYLYRDFGFIKADNFYTMRI